MSNTIEIKNQPIQPTPVSATNPPTIPAVSPKYVAIPIKPEYQIQNIEKQYPNLPRGYLPALVMQESRMGEMKPKDTTQFVGNYGWLVGFRNPAAEALKKKGIPFNLNTPDGAIKAAADYSTIRQKGKTYEGKDFNFTDATELYAKRYYGKNDTKESYKKYLDYYSQ